MTAIRCHCGRKVVELTYRPATGVVRWAGDYLTTEDGTLAPWQRFRCPREHDLEFELAAAMAAAGRAEKSFMADRSTVPSVRWTEPGQSLTGKVTRQMRLGHGGFDARIEPRT